MAVPQPPQHRRPLSAEQKIAFALLLFLGLGGIVLGFLSFGANLNRPFEIQYAESLKKGRFLTQEQKDQEEADKLKTRDSDGDGLVDYDELYVFKTSPYLADTDADGFDDKQEIFANEDPNCPRGTTCQGALAADSAGTAAMDAASGLLGGAPGGTATTGLTDQQQAAGFGSEQEVITFFRSLSTDQIRQILVEQGLPQDKVAALTDEEVRSAFDDAIAQMTDSGAIQDLVNAQAEPPATTPAGY